ncbi:hypothetical protein G2W53_034899 [Senna tora]|uniref:Uncharacterized protein n=1 Tax=Senna tora TaxID=362788 RepID=A0A834T015_9FABA|nr:hypothetical protein G2W53_034899 [Senna tora]
MRAAAWQFAPVDHCSILLHQHRRHNSVIIAAAAGHIGDDGGLDGTQAGVIGGGFHIRAFINVGVRIHESDPRRGSTVRIRRYDVAPEAEERPCGEGRGVRICGESKLDKGVNCLL